MIKKESGIIPKIICAIIVAFLYSITYIVLGPMAKTQNFIFDSSKILPFLLCLVICTIINSVIFVTFSKWRFDIKSEKISRFFDKFGDRKLFICIWVFIFISWIPAFLTLYPGVLSYDMISQTASALETIKTNHHPVLHTWLIRVFMEFGNKYLSSYENGIGLLSFLQMVILSYSLTRLAMLLKKKCVPVWLFIGTVLGSALWFMNAVLSVTMIKDTLHAAFFTLFACHFVEIVLNPSEYVSKKSNLVFLPIVAFFMFATRNNGLHIYLFCFAGLFLLRIFQVKKSNIKKYIVLVIMILLPVVIFKIYAGPVFEALNIEQGEVREALSVPIQQLQRVAITQATNLTEEQNDLMLFYITDLSWREWDPGRKYDAFMADPAKGCFYSNNYNKDPLTFWKFYLELGLEYPKEYMAAFLSNTLGFWYPDYYGFSYVMYENYEPESFLVPLERKSIVDVEIFETYYKSVCGSNFWRETYGLRIFFVSGFAPWLIGYGLVLAWRKKEFWAKIFPLFLPLIAQYGIMILSPMSSFRYSWPLYLILPLMFIAIFSYRDKESESVEV